MEDRDDNRPKADFTRHLDILKLIKEDAVILDRSISWLIVNACVEHYQKRKQEAELFKSRSLAEKREIPVYETPTLEQQAKKRAQEIRELHGQEKS